MCHHSVLEEGGRTAPSAVYELVRDDHVQGVYLLPETAHGADGDDPLHAQGLEGEMLARAGISDGLMRCPRPWRGRKATGVPSSLPTTMASLGSPKGVVGRTSWTCMRPSIS